MVFAQPTTLILCRHGESESNRDKRFGGHGPAPLTERGRAQARATGQQLFREGVAAVYSSDLVRAQQTAELIGRELALTPVVTPALRERCVGVFTGLTFDEARARFPDAYEVLLRREHDVAPPQGESYQTCQARAMACIEEVLSRHRGQRIVLVSHYLTLYLSVLHILGIQPAAAGPQVYVQMRNCALHRFEHYADGGWQVLTLNDTAHLSSLPE